MTVFPARWFPSPKATSFTVTGSPTGLPLVSSPHLHGACGAGRRRSAQIRKPYVDIKQARGSCVDGNVIHERFRDSLKINGPEDATVIPEITATFSVFHKSIRGLIVDVHLDLIRPTCGFEQTRDVVLEGVIAALVKRTRGLTVDGYLGIGHDPLEVDENRLLSPSCRRGKRPLVSAMNARPTARRSNSAIRIDAVTLEVPTGGNADRGPLSSVLAVVAYDLPLDRVVLPQTRNGGAD